MRNPSATRHGTGVLVAFDPASHTHIGLQRFRLEPGQGWTVVELPFSLEHPAGLEIRLAVDAGSAVTADRFTLDGPAVRTSFAALFPPGAYQAASR